MATLTVTINESLTLNGRERGNENKFTVDSVTEAYSRVLTCPATVETTIATFRSGVNVADSAIDLEDVKYLRVTNLNESTSVTMSLQVSAGENGVADASASILLEGGKTFMLGAVHDGIAVDDSQANLITSLNDLESLVIKGAASAVDVEVFVAS